MAICEENKKEKDQMDIDFENRINEIGIKAIKQFANFNKIYYQCLLGICYATGTKVKKNYRTAAYWYAKAAKQGFIPAQKTLSKCYELGRGVPQDDEKASKWLSKAIRQG